LKASQLSVVQLLAENRTLREENSELRANSTKKRRQGGEKDLLGYKSHIVALAKSFLITQALFVSLAAFRANPELPADPGEEFQSDEAYTLSITSKLYKEIPEKFHPLLDAKTYSTFAKDVSHPFIPLTVVLLSITQCTFLSSSSTSMGMGVQL
jgi:hypothetical protein